MINLNRLARIRPIIVRGSFVHIRTIGLLLNNLKNINTIVGYLASTIVRYLANIIAKYLANTITYLASTITEYIWLV